LIQTIGRAARNAEGRVLLYAYRVTPSMQHAIETTTARRQKQEQYNKDNKITPKTIIKDVSGGVIEVLRGNKTNKRKLKKNVELSHMTVEDIDKRILELKDLMQKAVKSLEFEQAAKYRDEIKQLTDMRMML
jgi:excinuclease ABC subunit B